MPTLKQIHCSIELGPSNIKLPEHGTTVGDGYTETFIAVPETNIPFNVHMRSEGYIGPGLAFFVFMDGDYQTNRNRIHLPMPGPGVASSDYEVEFRVRQKEEKTGAGMFLGREWTFTKMDKVKADKAPNLRSQFINNVGTIEVIVLRCQADSPGAPPRLMPGQASDTKATPTKPAQKHNREVSVREQAAESDGFFHLFDGSCDTMNLDGAGDALLADQGGDARPETPGNLPWDPVLGDFRPPSPHVGYGGIDLSPVVLKQGMAQQAAPQQFDGYGDDGIAVAREQEGNQHVNFQAAPTNRQVQTANHIKNVLGRLCAVEGGDFPYPAGAAGIFMFEQDIRELKRILGHMRTRNPDLYAAQAQNMPQVGPLVAQLLAMKGGLQQGLGQAAVNKPMQPRPILKTAAKPVPKDAHYDPKDFTEVKGLPGLLANDLMREFLAAPKVDFLGRQEKRLDVDSELPFRLKEGLKDIEIMMRCVEFMSVNRFKIKFPHLRQTLGQLQCDTLNDKDLRKPIWNTVASIEAYLKDIETRREGIQNFIKALNEESMKFLDHEEKAEEAKKRLDEVDREMELFQHQIQVIRAGGIDAREYIVHFPLANLDPDDRGKFDDVDPHAWGEHAYDNMPLEAETLQRRAVNNMGRQDIGRGDGAFDQRAGINNPGWQEVGQGVANALPHYQDFVPAGIPGVAGPYNQAPNMGIDPTGYGAQQPYQMHPQAQGVPPGAWGAMKQTPFVNAQFAAGGQYQGIQQQNLGGYGYGQFQGRPQQNPGFRGYAASGGMMQPANRFTGKVDAQDDPDEGMLNKRAPMKPLAPEWRDYERKDDGGKGSAFTLAHARNPNFHISSVFGKDDGNENKKSKPNKTASGLDADAGGVASNADQNDGWDRNNNNDQWNNNNNDGGGNSKAGNGWGNDAANEDVGGGWGQEKAGRSTNKGNDNWGNYAASKSNNTTSENKNSTRDGWGSRDARNRGSQRRTSNVDPESHVKPYWKDWNKPQLNDETNMKKHNEPRDAYRYPALPRPVIPENKAKDKDHGIQAGKGAEYAHKCRQPTYIDSMDKPYAVFTFKYRSKGAVEKILGIKINDMDLKKMKYEIEYDKLMHQPKNKLVEDLAKMRMGSGSQAPAGTTSDNRSHNDGYGGGSNKSPSHGGGWNNDEQKSDQGWNNSKSKTPSNNGWSSPAQEKKASKNGWSSPKPNNPVKGGWDDAGKKPSAKKHHWGGDGANNAWEGADNNAKWNGDNNNNNKNIAADAGKAERANKHNVWTGDKFKKASKAEVAKTYEHFEGQAGMQDGRMFNEKKVNKLRDDPNDKYWF